MSADDRNCTGHFCVDTFCLALHGADLHIRSGAWSTKHGNCSAWRGCADYLFPAEWCDFAGYGIFDQPDGAAAGCDLAAGKGAEFEICDPGLDVWVNDVNKSGMKRSRTMGDETQCPASLFIRNEL